MSLYLGISIIVSLEVIEYILLLLFNIGSFLITGRLKVTPNQKSTPSQILVKSASDEKEEPPLFPLPTTKEELKAPPPCQYTKPAQGDVAPTITERVNIKIRKELYNQFDF